MAVLDELFGGRDPAAIVPARYRGTGDPAAAPQMTPEEREAALEIGLANVERMLQNRRVTKGLAVSLDRLAGDMAQADAFDQEEAELARDVVRP